MYNIRPVSYFVLHAYFSLFYSAPGIPRIIVLPSRQFRLHDYDDLRRWVMSMDFRSSCIYSLRCCSDNRAEMIMSLLYSSELKTFVPIGSFWCSLERSVSLIEGNIQIQAVYQANRHAQHLRRFGSWDQGLSLQCAQIPPS
jgi:hypothetical protein